MKILFIALAESDFPLLLKWLKTLHVKAWWDRDVEWTPELIYEKYISYTKGHKLENGVAKPMHAYIIYADDTPIGYIQIYNAYDFPRSTPLTGLPINLAAFDVLIGEEQYLKQGTGAKAIVQFLEAHGRSYTHVFSDPPSSNLAAIRTYEKAGFKKINEHTDAGEIWMIREQQQCPEPFEAVKKLKHSPAINCGGVLQGRLIHSDIMMFIGRIC